MCLLYCKDLAVDWEEATPGTCVLCAPLISAGWSWCTCFLFHEGTVLGKNVLGTLQWRAGECRRLQSQSSPAPAPLVSLAAHTSPRGPPHCSSLDPQTALTSPVAPELESGNESGDHASSSIWQESWTLHSRKGKAIYLWCSHLCDEKEFVLFAGIL